MNIGIILAGGTGSRFNSSTPKQYLKLNGKEVITYSIEAIQGSKKIDKLILVMDETQLKSREDHFHGLECIAGGETRNASIKNALDYIKLKYPLVGNIFLQEAARPFINSNIIDFYMESLDAYDAVVTSVKITDSLASLNGESVDRDNFHLIQSPEAFRFNSIYEDFRSESIITSTSHQLKPGRKIKYFYDIGFNLKITYPNDLFLAEQLLKYSYYKKNSKPFTEMSSKKTVLLLGASGGLGQGVFNALRNLDVNLICPSSNDFDLEKITEDDVKNLCINNPPDVVINCAAYSVNDQAGLTAPFEKIFNVNLKSNLVLLEYFKFVDKRINFLVISSSSSTKGRTNLTLYSATKAALNSIIESQAAEALQHSIYLNALIPEKIDTPLIKKLHQEREIKCNEMLSIDKVVDAIIDIAFSDRHGQLVHLRCGL